MRTTSASSLSRSKRSHGMSSSVHEPMPPPSASELPFYTPARKKGPGVGRWRSGSAFLDRAPEPVHMLLNRLSSLKPSGMSERWREREFPNDVIGDQRLPLSWAEKRFNMSLQKVRGHGHRRSFPVEPTLPALSLA